MTTAVDSNVLIDLTAGHTRAEATGRAIDSALRLGQVVICPVVYSEIVRSFSRSEALEQFLTEMLIVTEEFSKPALWEAGQAWNQYTAGRGRHLHCAACGAMSDYSCPSCGSALTARQHLITDFLIGAHALTQADGLLTRDQGYYRTYFPDLKLMVPSSS